MQQNGSLAAGYTLAVAMVAGMYRVKYLFRT